MQISGYYVGYKPQATSEPFIYKTVEVDNKGVKEEFVIGGLQKNTKYVILVQAFNGQGAGPAADEIVVKTYEYGEYGCRFNSPFKRGVIAFEPHQFL